MLMKIVPAVLLLVVLAAAGCAPEYSRHHGYGRRYSSDDAWEVVRNDPCRYEEYGRFAAEHKNPARRREFVEQLAREGCSRGRYGYDDDRGGARYGNDDDRDEDRAWNIVRNDPCRSEEYRRFAAEHKSPARRREFVEQLAREGCSLDRRRRY